jgi:hypothetical protein
MGENMGGITKRQFELLKQAKDSSIILGISCGMDDIEDLDDLAEREYVDKVYDRVKGIIFYRSTYIGNKALEWAIAVNLAS